ncbi:beta strand repeat-containing protein [Helicobacter sp. T3_23-1056]
MRHSHNAHGASCATSLPNTLKVGSTLPKIACSVVVAAALLPNMALSVDVNLSDDGKNQNYTAQDADAIKSGEGVNVKVDSGVTVSEISGADASNVTKITGTLSNAGTITDIKANTVIGTAGDTSTGIANTGTITKISGGTINGSITNNNGGSIADINGTATINANIDNQKGATLKITSGTLNGNIQNSGTIEAIAGGTLDGNVSNSGTITTISGSGTFKNTLQNNAGGTIATISGGTFSNGVSNAGSITTISADTGNLSNSGSITTISADLTKDVANSGKITTISGGVAGVLNNSGEINALGGAGKTYKDVQNRGTIASIEDGTFTNVTNSNTITEIKKGTFTNLDNSGNIGTITDGTISKGSNTGTIGELKGGTLTLDNNGTISKISGGTFTGANNRNIGEISTNAIIKGTNAGNIDTISGGTFTDNAATAGAYINSGAIQNLGGGTFSEGLSNTGSISQITDGTFTKALDNKGSIGTINGIAANGTINNAGTISNVELNVASKDTIAALNNNAGGKISNISAGTITTLTNEANASIDNLGKATITNAFDNKGVVSNINGATFSAKLTNSGQIGTIASGSFAAEGIANSAGASIANITGLGNAALAKLDNSGNIGNISGGEITALTNNAYANISNISNLANVGTVTNSKDASIESISGGKITTTLDNKGIIGTIQGGEIATLNNKGDATNAARIISIAGGKITTFTNGENAQQPQDVKIAKVDSISGGEITTLTNTALSSIDSISGGVFGTAGSNPSNAAPVAESGGLTNNASIGKISGGRFYNELKNEGEATKLANIGEISGGTFTKITNGVANDAKSQHSTIGIISGGNIAELINAGKDANTAKINEISGGNIAKLDNKGSIGKITGGNIAEVVNASKNSITDISGGTINVLNNTGGAITTIGANAKINALDNGTTGTITNLTLNNGNIGYNEATKAHLNGTITNLNLQAWNLTIDGTAAQWDASNDKNAHIYANKDIDVQTASVANGAITVNVGDNVKSNEVYSFGKVFKGVDSTGASAAFEKQTTKESLPIAVSASSIKTTQGLKLNATTNGFGLSGDVVNSYGAQVLQNLALNSVRKTLITQGLLDSLVNHNYFSVVNDEEAKDDKASKKWRGFVLPYATLGNANLSAANQSEVAGGALLGFQYATGGSLASLYLGYEYAKANLDFNQAGVASSSAALNTNAINIGLNVLSKFGNGETFQPFVKANIRANVELPELTISATNVNAKAKLLSYTIGAEAKIGAALLFKSKESYLAPEVGLSYDVLHLDGFALKTANTEKYVEHNWQLPQVGAGAKWYHSWHKIFKTSLNAGVKYNILHTPYASFTLGGLDENIARINLPKIYGNVDANAIFAINKDHELTLGYNGVFYNSGKAHSVALKYGFRF